MDFKAGDRVVIRDWDDMEQEFGLNEYGNIDCHKVFTEEMAYLCGSEHTILRISASGLVKFEDSSSDGFYISTDMIRHVDDVREPDPDVPMDEFFAVIGV